MKKSFLAIVVLVCLFFGAMPLMAVENISYVIDTPTSEMLDYGMYNLSFRLFTNGGILSRLNFGVFKVVNMGFGWEVNKVIGSQDTSVSPPALAVKIKAYEGSMVLPSIAFGYDGQGYSYNKDLAQFTDREKGIYLVFGREVFVPGLSMNFGGNIYDFKEGQVYGFFNANYNIDKKFYFLVEYDNIHYLPDARINAGVKLLINDDLNIDLAGRDIGARDGRVTERIVSINYVGRF
jgi:hypothetical protein